MKTELPGFVPEVGKSLTFAVAQIIKNPALEHQQYVVLFTPTRQCFFFQKQFNVVYSMSVFSSLSQSPFPRRLGPFMGKMPQLDTRDELIGETRVHSQFRHVCKNMTERYRSL